MITKDALMNALASIYSTSPPNRPLPQERIKKTLAEYMCVPESDIESSLLIESLKEIPIAFPKPSVKGKSLIQWFFRKGKEANVPKRNKPNRNFKIRSIAETQKLKK